MKKRMVRIVLSLMITVSVAVSSPAVLWAAGTETPAEADIETNDAAEEKAGKNFRIMLETGEIEVKNQTTRTYTSAEYKKAETKNANEEAIEGDVDTSGENAKEQWNLEVTEEDGTVHIFENVIPDKWKNPVIVDSYGFLYIHYQDENGNAQEAIETADEKKFDQPITMYVSTNVHIRKEASKDAESLKILALGEEWQATGAVPGWFRVEKDGISGYVFHSYLTEDKESVEEALKAKQEAEAVAAVQAAAEAQAAQASAKAVASAPQVYEVSRQAYDDCDGSGHGYYEITYSDGSVVYEEY